MPFVDTRPAPFTVGLRPTPVGAGEVFEVTVHGANGDCTGPLAIPADAVGVALNVTTVNATATSNIRVYPANLTEVPTLSNLNVTAGAPPTPNKVDVQLSPDGKIRVFNFRGTVNIFIDVVGYYTNSTLQELSQRVVALEAAEAAGVDPAVLARLDAVESKLETLHNPVTAVATEPGTSSLLSTQTVHATLTVNPTFDGTVSAASTAYVYQSSTAQLVARCYLTTGTTSEFGAQQYANINVGQFASEVIAGTRLFDAQEGVPITINLVCNAVASTGSIGEIWLTAVLLPA